MRRRLAYGLLSAVALIALGKPTKTNAATAVVWETTFRCADWNQSMGLSDSAVCGPSDGLAGWGAWTPVTIPTGDEIIVAANNPAGAGGSGFRHWRGDGSNSGGGGLRVTLPATYPELWIRFFMRYQSGFSWSQLNYTKELYVDAGSTSGAFTVGFHGTNSFGLATNSPSRNMVGSPGWTSANGGAVGDGQWHCYEAHAKISTSGANGIAEAWVNGTQSVNLRDVDFNSTPGWSYFALGSNQSAPNNGGDRYTDYDDVAVSTTGRIGCGTTGTVVAAPAAPLNVHIVR